MAYEENKSDRLQELQGSDFKIAEHQPDITGWEIFDAAGYYIGDVDDLIFDRESLKVRYIVTDLDDLERAYSNTQVEEQKQVLIPIGLVTLNEDEVILTTELANNVGFLPTYVKGVITPAQEILIRDVLSGNLASNITEADYGTHPDSFYEHQHFCDTGYTRYKTGRDGLDAGEIM